MYFCKKNMKKILFLFSFFLIVSLLSSCGLYKEPCEGVGSINDNYENNI